MDESTASMPNGMAVPARNFGFNDAEEDVMFRSSWMAAKRARLSTDATIHKSRQSLIENSANEPRKKNYISAYLKSEWNHYAQNSDPSRDPVSKDLADEQGTDKVCENITCSDIQEIALDTLRKPEGPQKALEYFSDAVDKALKILRKDHLDKRKTFTYIYTAHPDKHMHRLGTEHESITQIVQGLDAQLARLWNGVKEIVKDSGSCGKATLFVTADHGHVTVKSADLVTLPESLTQYLSYANVGGTGQGRHAYLHVKSGLTEDFVESWRNDPENARLRDNFLLLRVEDAAQKGLFGPEKRVDKRVRPRLGDLLVMSLNAKTLLSEHELRQLNQEHGEGNVVIGAHGSCTREEMEIPYVVARCE